MLLGPQAQNYLWIRLKPIPRKRLHIDTETRCFNKFTPAHGFEHCCACQMVIGFSVSLSWITSVDVHSHLTAPDINTLMRQTRLARMQIPHGLYHPFFGGPPLSIMNKTRREWSSSSACLSRGSASFSRSSAVIAAVWRA